MRLNLVSIELDHFGSFRNKTVIDFQERGPGLHFLRGKNEDEPRLGSNGAGKSTIWNGLVWCFFGKTPGGLRNTDIAPWGGKETATVKAKLTGGTVVRTANPNSLKIDDQAVGQEQVEQLIGLNFDAFCSTILLGQGRPLFFDLTPTAKMELFSSVLDLDRWEARSKAAGKRAKDLQRDLDQIAGEITGLTSELRQLDDLVERTNQSSTDWENARQERLKLIEDDASLTELQFEEITTMLRKAEVDYDGSMVEWRSADQKLGQIKADVKSITDAITKAENDLKAKICPTCRQPINNTTDHKQHVQKGLKQSQSVMLRLIKDIETWEPIVKDMWDKVREADARIELHRPRHAELKAEVKRLKELQDDKGSEHNPYREQLRDLKKRIKNAEAREDELHLERDDISADMERSQYWVKGFREVRLQIIEEVLQELELATNAMLSDIGLVDWQVLYDIEKETKSGTVKSGLNVSILSPNNDKPVKWESWSGGEGQRLRLVGSLALSDVLLNNAGIEAGFEILDEPSSHLSPEGVRDMCDFLADRALVQERMVWYVDHTAVESTRFKSSLTVVKTSGGSYVKGHQRPSEDESDTDSRKAPKSLPRATRREKAGVSR